MAGITKNTGDGGAGSKPGQIKLPLTPATLPPVPRDEIEGDQVLQTISDSFREDVRTITARYFPGNLDAPHAVSAAGIFAIVRAGVSHWIDGACPDEYFIKEGGKTLADLKQLPIKSLVTFMRERSADIEKIAELLQSSPSPATDELALSHVVVMTSLVHAKRNLLRGASIHVLLNDSITALDLARRMEPPLLDQWRGVVRHMLRGAIDGMKGEGDTVPSEVIAWRYANPCTFLFPLVCVIDSPKTFVGSILEGSKLLFSTGVMPSFVEEAKQLSSDGAASLFGRTVAKIDEVLPRITKDHSSAARTLSDLLGQLTVTDRLPLLDILATDSRATEIARRLESYQLLKSDAAYASWLIVQRERIVECGGASAPFADHLLDLAKGRPGIRPALVALVTWSDRLAAADLLAVTFSLIKSPLDPSMVEQRIRAAGAALHGGATSAEARAILDRGVQPDASASLDGGRRVAGTPSTSMSRPIQTILEERLAALPDVQAWVTRTFEAGEGHPELLRCLRRVAAMPPEATPRFAAFLHEYGSALRCREFLASPSSFERLTRFLAAGRHEEIREFKMWLRGDTAVDPAALRGLRGLRAGPSAAIAAAEEEERGKSPVRGELVLIPSGSYKRLVVVGGVYSPPKRAAIQESAGDIPVLYLSPDAEPRSIRQTLAKNDLVVINPTWNSHATTERVIAQCRANEITWVMVPFSGYKALANIAEQMQR